MHCLGFSLKHTLDSGQFFRYHEQDEWYYIVTRDKVFYVKQTQDELLFEGASARFVRHFFGLDEDYARITRELSQDPVLARAIRTYAGLRLIRQDPWECTIGFLCSQLSNIKKIKHNMECIATLFGTPVVFKGKTFHTFPPPGAITDAVKLKACAVGFRAKYILAVNDTVSDKWFAKLRTLPYERARERLMELPGIGEKVADCILLFSLGFTEAFPVDVWMERVLTEQYFPHKKKQPKDLVAFGKNKWGAHAGYAQQYLYHWARMHKSTHTF
ncbi:8-oxoguanine DNA glycosylase [Candidatus Woesearchaeota archaeon]|nr:8-oxoguanine DNA glycosylase [Candidatus Woesearchaeota archaeon]